MKEQQLKQTVGVWMDHHHAIFIAAENQDGVYEIGEKIKADVYQGMSGEHGANNAERSDNRKYHKAIGNQLLKYDEILIFGPGTAQEELLNFLHEDMHFKNKKFTLDTAAKISDNQMIAKVREFFATPQP